MKWKEATSISEGQNSITCLTCWRERKGLLSLSGHDLPETSIAFARSAKQWAEHLTSCQAPLIPLTSGNGARQES